MMMGACGVPHLLLHQLPPQAAPGTECRWADGGGGRGVARNVRVAAHRLRRHLAQFSTAASVLSNPGRALALQVHPVSWQGSGQVGCCCSSPMASVTRPGRMLMRYPRLVSTCSMAKRRGGRAGLCTQPRHVLRHQDSSGRVCECSACCCWEQPSAHRQEVCGGAAAGCLAPWGRLPCLEGLTLPSGIMFQAASSVRLAAPSDSPLRALLPWAGSTLQQGGWRSWGGGMAHAQLPWWRSGSKRELWHDGHSAAHTPAPDVPDVDGAHVEVCAGRLGDGWAQASWLGQQRAAVERRRPRRVGGWARRLSRAVICWSRARYKQQCSRRQQQQGLLGQHSVSAGASLQRFGAMIRCMFSADNAPCFAAEGRCRAGMSDRSPHGTWHLGGQLQDSGSYP